ncbi:MAG: MFS transporter, partial [Chloroflexi bacterium]
MAETNIRGLRWAYVLIGVADGTLLPFLPLYMLERGMSAALIGAVLAASAGAAVAGGLAWAVVADRWFRPERLVVLASVAAAAAALLMVPFGAGASLAVVIVLLSVARSPLTLLDPITLRRLRVTSRTDYARIRLRMSAGWAASAIVSGGVYQALGLRLIPL